MAGGDGGDRLVVGRQPVKVDRHNHARLQPAGRDRLVDGALEIGRVEVEGCLVHVDEDRRGADRDDGAGGGRKGERRHEHGIARLHAHGHQGDHQRVAPARHGDGVAGAGEAGEALLELVHLRSKHELAVGEHRIHAPADVAADARVLALQVEKRDATVFGDGQSGAG